MRPDLYLSNFLKWHLEPTNFKLLSFFILYTLRIHAKDNLCYCYKNENENDRKENNKLFFDLIANTSWHFSICKLSIAAHWNIGPKRKGSFKGSTQRFNITSTILILYYISRSYLDTSTSDVSGGCTMYRQADSLPLSLNLVLGSVTRSTEYIKFWWSKEKNDGSCKMLFHLFACNQWKWVLTIFSLDLNVSCQNWPKLNLYIICRYNICNLYNIY